jgi:hypothetical protein
MQSPTMLDNSSERKWTAAFGGDMLMCAPEYRAARLIPIGVALAGLLILYGCGGPTPTPIVDMTGVDLAKYNFDEAACVKQEQVKVLVLGNGVTRCMKDKGYKILVGY